MLSLSQTTGYAIKALACLPERGAAPRQVADVARCTGIPRAYLAKIIHRLARRGLVAARRGQRGGIALARLAAEISLLHIVEAVEGPDWLGHCLLGLDECRDQQECPTHDFWRDFCAQLRAKLAATSLASVIAAFPDRARCNNRGPATPDTARPVRRGAGRPAGNGKASRHE